MKRVIKELFLKFKVAFSRATNSSDLDFFFNRIRPLTSSIELVRIGGINDAGYLVPNDFKNIKYCFSPGVSIEAYFENELAEKYNIKSFMADFSVDQSPILNDKLEFKKIFIGYENKPGFQSLQNWISESIGELDEDMILQMDIEGGEYNVLIETSNEELEKFRILIIEFHFFDQIYSRPGFELVSACFYKLLKSFNIVHIHPNNCSALVKFGNYSVPPVIEFTFHRKDRAQFFKSESLSFPHSLDKDNQPTKKSIILPECFYKVVDNINQ
jgi:hypothetical protein